MDTLTTVHALETAIEALHLAASNTDTASPEGSRYRAAIETLEMIRGQRGVAHLGEKVDRLTDLIDVVVFG